MSFANAFSNLFKIAELRKRLLFTLWLPRGLPHRHRRHRPRRRPGGDEEGDRGDAAGSSASSTCSPAARLEQLSIFALGIMPYVRARASSSSCSRWWSPSSRSSPRKESGPAQDHPVDALRHHRALHRAGRSASPRYLESVKRRQRGVGRPTTSNRAGASACMTVITLTAGTAFIMWLGEQITERGIGNGISLIIFAGIVARHPGRGVRPGPPSRTRPRIPTSDILSSSRSCW